MYLPEVVSFTI